MVVDIVSQIVGGNLVVVILMCDDNQMSFMYVMKCMCDSFVMIVEQVYISIDMLVMVFEQIVIGNFDLLICMQEQVLVLEECVVLMEELNVIVKQNVDYVWYVNQFVVMVVEVVM